MMKLMLDLIKDVPDAVTTEIKEVESDPGRLWAPGSLPPNSDGMNPCTPLERPVSELR